MCLVFGQRPRPSAPMSIRDTSAQDQRLAPAAQQGRRRRQWALAAAVGAVVLGAGAWVASGWAAGGTSVSAQDQAIDEMAQSKDKVVQ